MKILICKKLKKLILRNLFTLFIIYQILMIYLVYTKYILNSNSHNGNILIKENNYKYFDYELNPKIQLNNTMNNIDYENNIFAIIRYPVCQSCGFFSYFNIYISCIKTYIIKGYIPIVELESFPNIFNSFKANSSTENPWEYFFNQPFGYTIKNIKKKAKNIKFFNCENEETKPRCLDIYSKKIAIDFWHNIALKYIPIKDSILKETNIIIKTLFSNSKNLLGVLIRGTDYIAIKPRGHPIPPKVETVIKDIKEMDNKYKYDYFFLATEDNLIRNALYKVFGKKLKYLLPKRNINYNYLSPKYLSYTESIKGNLANMKDYLINIIILSKCIDIIASRTNGSVGAFIFSEGFRNIKIYYLGLY